MGLMAISPRASQTMSAALDRVLAVIDRAGPSAAIPTDLRVQARANALELGRAWDPIADGLRHATVAYAAELLGAIAGDLADDPAGTRHLIDELQSGAGVPRVPLGRELLRDGRLLGGPAADVAITVPLSLLLAFTGADAISLWTLGDDGEPTPGSVVGMSDGPDAETAARAALADAGPGLVTSGGTLALRVDGSWPPAATLIAQGVDPLSPPGPLLRAAVPALAGLLDRARRLDREQSREPATGAAEQRLARLRFDLHDGPQQDLHLLAEDLRLFRDQLRPMIAGNPDQDRALGRLDDLEAQLIALDGDLRRLATATPSPVLTPGSLRQALERLTAAFAQRTGISPEIDLSGDLTRLTDSRQTALLSLIREALTNIRKHSGAGSVRIVIASVNDGVTARISDDGRGFDPRETLERAGESGGLGLTGMQQRLKMLGGRTEIASKPGGPTVISATLPPADPGPG
jgi:signal transduction histidine kinase